MDRVGASSDGITIGPRDLPAFDTDDPFRLGRLLYGKILGFDPL
jgi:hypothetical protein